MELPTINWFGGLLVTRSLLEWTKSGVDDDDDESFLTKMSRPNLVNRVMLLTVALNAHGPTLEAAEMIQGGSKGFFTGVSAEALAEKLAEAVKRLRKGGIWKFRTAEFGALAFDAVKASHSPPDNDAAD